VQQGPKYSPGTTFSLVYIIKKNRISNFVPKYFISVVATMQVGIATPPLRYPRPASSRGPCKNVVNTALRARRS